VGLADDMTTHLFEPFVSTKGKSMGLGLSITRSIVEAHGGEISAMSNSAGGATFRFTLSANESQDVE
jgi:two-component system sensor kinase FixL